MAKQLLVDSLKQQLAQTESLTEAQLNNLLDRLESQKARLPQEDHSIIDWGIGAVRIRLQQREQVMNKTKDDIMMMGQALIEKCRTHSDVLELIKEDLPKIIQEGSDLKYDDGIREVVLDLISYFTQESTLNEVTRNKLFDDVSDFCKGRVSNLNTKIAAKEHAKSEEELKIPRDLVQHYSSIVKDFDSAKSVVSSSATTQSSDQTLDSSNISELTSQYI
jgi:hypothetical protein